MAASPVPPPPPSPLGSPGARPPVLSGKPAGNNTQRGWRAAAGTAFLRVMQSGPAQATVNFGRNLPGNGVAFAKALPRNSLRFAVALPLKPIAFGIVMAAGDAVVERHLPWLSLAAEAGAVGLVARGASQFINGSIEYARFVKADRQRAGLYTRNYIKSCNWVPPVLGFTAAVTDFVTGPYLPKIYSGIDASNVPVVAEALMTGVIAYRGARFISKAIWNSRRVRTPAEITKLHEKMAKRQQRIVKNRAARKARRQAIKQVLYHPLTAVGAGITASLACYYTRSYTHTSAPPHGVASDAFISNSAHIGLTGAFEVGVAGLLATGAVYWLQGLHARHPVTSIKHVLIAGAALFVVEPVLVGSTTDPFLSIPSRTLRSVGIEPLQGGAVEAAYNELKSSPLSKKTILPGEHIAAYVTSGNTVYGVNSNGEPDIKNALPEANGSAVCLTSSTDDFFIMSTAAGGKYFVPRFAVTEGGDGCQILAAAKRPAANAQPPQVRQGQRPQR